MAGGFWKGLLQGTIIGAAGLAGLSLMAPLPETAVTPMQAGAGSDEAPVSVQPAPKPVQTAPKARIQPETPDPASAKPASVVKPDSPAGKKSLAAMVDLPPGSEFGRGDDMQLRRPAPFAAGRGRTEPSFISVPVTDSVLVSASATNQRPRTNPQGQGITPRTSSATEETPEFIRPAGESTPTGAALPGKAVANSDHDSLPVSAPVQAVARGSLDVTVDTSAGLTRPDLPAINPPEPQQVSQDAAPSLQVPAFNLSMPPDLTNLRALQEN